MRCQTRDMGKQELTGAGTMNIKPTIRRRMGFTLVELLVVIGIIALLIGILMPTLTQARERAKAIKCMANMRSVGQQLLIYAQENGGWLFPVGPWIDHWSNGEPPRYESLGTNQYPWNRWQMYAGFDFTAPAPPNPLPPPGNEAQYSISYAANGVASYGPLLGEVHKWNPPVLQCPSDESVTGNSYILNKHLQRSPEQLLRLGKHANKSNSEVILMGEKVTVRDDCYMEVMSDDPSQGQLQTEFTRVVESQRHGRTYGSNYLFLDYHVDRLPSATDATNAMDPWYVAPASSGEPVPTPDPVTPAP